MNDLRSILQSLLATAALLVCASPAMAQVSLGAASGFAVLGGTNVTCTHAVVTGDIVSPRRRRSYTNTGCTIKGDTPPATNRTAAQARNDFLSAYLRSSSPRWQRARRGPLRPRLFRPVSTVSTRQRRLAR
jgi:hypothetical protein